ncbi:FAD/NAD(P)-binding domain-containing protein [Dendrothele bispora CBS 962.96]|uniref:FAD/NAD(P)-binding domain-containing protein n=1 Tax=Dendrothele bispora (strain CBS 962.96) TaxID=1314807 RepID=A0A4S8LD63_DENBC|nr:FAD/NAD(P)-binding domain-containing protein [Dendrothele bispora CBS 962.96]
MRVAIIGSGVSGLAATWLLNEYSGHEPHLYEADDRPGGHANTATFHPDKSSKKSVDVDTGFIVFNPSTYPNFLRFLRMHPDIPIAPTDMTFSVSRDGGAFEWKGDTLFTVFCQARRVLDPGMWRMLYDILRFNACARRLIIQWKARKSDKDRHDGEEMAIGEYLGREGYSQEFIENYLVPMTAAIWSTPPTKTALSFPFRTLVQFMHNHHLLQLTGKPSWLTLPGGSKQYVDEILKKVPKGQVHLSTPVHSVTSLNSDDPARAKVLIKTASGTSETYDHVIMACHSDESLRILRAGGLTQDEIPPLVSSSSLRLRSSPSPSPTASAFDSDSGIEVGVGGGKTDGSSEDCAGSKDGLVGGITPDEEKILSIFQWNRNECVLHNDPRLMPKRKMAWGCWNYLGVPSKDGNKAVDRVCLTYGMNDLQHISEKQYGPVLVTLNAPPELQPEEDTVRGRWKYDHPVLDKEAVRAQSLMPRIQGTRSISYAGAYLNYGFHEDGFTAGLLAATRYAPKLMESGGVKMPFEIEFSEGNRIGEAALKNKKSKSKSKGIIAKFKRDKGRGLLKTLGECVVLGLAKSFDVFEASGARIAIGSVLGTILVYVAWVMEKLGIWDMIGC